MINLKFFACEPRVYYPLRNPYYIDTWCETIIHKMFILLKCIHVLLIGITEISYQEIYSVLFVQTLSVKEV